MDSNKDTLQVEINGLQGLFNEKINNLMTLSNLSSKQNNDDHAQIKQGLTEVNETLTKHNGRLTTIEKVIEQGKGASKVLQWGWIVFAFIIGGFVFPIVLKAMGF